MDRWPALLFALLLLLSPLRPERPPADEGPERLQAEWDAVLEKSVGCFQRGAGARFLQAALRLAEIRTHPAFQAARGQDGENRLRRQDLLLAAARLRDRFAAGGCPPAGSETELVRLGQDFVCAGESAWAEASWSVPPAFLSIARLRRALSPSQLLLKYVLQRDRVFVFWLAASGAGCDVLPFGRAQVVDMVRRLSQPLEAFADGRVDYLRVHFDLQLAQRLYNILLRGILERHPLAGELLIVPDDELFKLPFEALVTGFRDQLPVRDALFSEYEAAAYLIQDCRVSYLVSLADLLVPFPGHGEYALELAAFGGPLPPAREAGAASRLADAAVALPSTRQEVLELDKIFDGSRRRVFLGADFNWENFSRFAPRARVVHLASHFFVDAGDPQRSAFLFSARGQDPAFCDARRFRGLKLPAELAVLSACETSEKDLLAFKRLGGVTAAFRRAGVRSLISSLWPVDEFSSQVVPPFYREYLAAADGAAALRAAKLEILGKTVSLGDGVRLSLAHPFVWANFVLYRFFR